MPIMTQDAPAADVFMCHSESLNEHYHSPFLTVSLLSSWPREERSWELFEGLRHSPRLLQKQTLHVGVVAGLMMMNKWCILGVNTRDVCYYSPRGD